MKSNVRGVRSGYPLVIEAEHIETRNSDANTGNSASVMSRRYNEQSCIVPLWRCDGVAMWRYGGVVTVNADAHFIFDYRFRAAEEAAVRQD